MSSPLDLIDLGPAAEVAVLGLVLAVLPVSLVVWQSRRAGLRGWPAWQRALTVATLFLTLDLVVFGAFTRLTDSGLGCPDWPGCYGHTSPVGAREAISAAELLRPTGPVSHSKAWIEMVHRYLATSVGALITLLMALAWRMRRHAGGLSPWWATATFVWVCAQGAFGALTVTMKLQPLIVSFHLLGAMLGVGLLTAQARVLDPWPFTPADWFTWRQSSLRRWTVGVLLICVIQMAAGAWVSTNYAVLACTEFPTCQGGWWPNMDFSTGFTLWRPLGSDGQGGWIALPALTAIHMVHRMFAVVALASLVWLAWSLKRMQWARTDRRWLWALLLWQFATGLSNVVLDWPLAAALGHTLGAALIVWRLVRLMILPRHRGLPAADSGATL
ncbi:MAG TPA: COX15/CtaA family protein [Aquabacterium sp.]|nr:COX15/CtaA family protein [Aquabacterium sp.]